MLVMFFVFHILVFTISFCEVNSAPRRVHSPDIERVESFPKGNVPIYKLRDGKKNTAFRTSKPMFQILRNHTKSGNVNLKSNIFDKMLSEEMLSIKQKFFEKDLIQSSTVNNRKQTSVPTPTIEVQQKWSVVDLFTNREIYEDTENFLENANEAIKSHNDTDLSLDDSENTSENAKEEITPKENMEPVYDLSSKNNNNADELETIIDHSNSESNNMSDNKILELRSLQSLRHSEQNNQGHVVDNEGCSHAPSKCSCTRQVYDQGMTTPDHTCCTHTAPNGGISYSYSVYPMYIQPYQTYVFNDYNENRYQLHKSKKPKRRKTTPVPADFYYDDNKSKEEYDDDNCKSRQRHKPSPNIVLDINYDIADSTPRSVIKGNRDNINLINELNEVYEGVKKKCYCSHSTLVSTDQRIFFCIFVIARMFVIFS